MLLMLLLLLAAAAAGLFLTTLQLLAFDEKSTFDCFALFRHINRGSLYTKFSMRK
jgi:hypothetical protein